MNRYIDVSGFVDEFKEGTNIGIVVTLRNPAYAHITVEFGVAIMRDFTQIMYDRKLDIPGVTIVAGLISDIKITKIDSDIAITRNKLMKFQLAFKVSNALKDATMLKFIFPASFKVYDYDILSIPKSYWIDYGLEDKSEEDPLVPQLDVANDILYIKNFKEKSQPDLIILKFWATTPDNAGESSPVEIRSYTDVDESYIIDEDAQFAKITVLDVPSPTSWTYSLSEDFAGLGRTVVVTFTIQPGISIPAGGFIKVIFDNDLIIKEVNTDRCLLYQTSTTSYVSSKTCFKRNREISVQLNSEQYTANNTYSFKFSSVLESPQYGGRYLVDITTYQTDGTSKIESYTQVLQFRSAKLTFPLINLYPKEHLQKSFLDIEFTVPMDIPHSRPQNISTETVSFINVGIEPSGPTLLVNDLNYTSYGTGNIPCMAIKGLEAVNGSMVDCHIKSGGIPSVRVTNYHAIKSGTRIRIIIADFSNPDGNFIANVKIMKKFNRRLTEMCSSQETLEITNKANTPVAHTDAQGDDRNQFYTANVTEVNLEFQIEFNMRIKQIVNGNEKIIVEFPHYDKGFVYLDKQPRCYVNDLPYTCYGIPYCDWIMIELAEYESIAVSSDVILKFAGLKWPRIEKPNPGNVKIRVSNTTKDTKDIYIYPELLVANPSTFSKIALVQDKKKRGDIDCRYTFEFTTKTGIPNGGSLTMNFPSEYNLIATSPAVRVSYPDFKDKSSTDKLSHFYTANKLKISNIGEIPIGDSFRVIFNGLTNPDYGGVMSDWFIDTLYNEFSLSRQDNFISISLENQGEIGEIKLLSMSILPTNADAKGEYIFKIQPQIKLSVGSEIHITFPEEFKVIPDSPNCHITGGIKTFLSCLKEFNSIVIRLDLDYSINQGPITVTLRDIVNPDAGKTSSFEIYSKYDGTTLEQTAVSSKESRKVEIASKASTIKILTTDINPQNEAELSTYTITFLPTNDIGFYQEIVFIFPETFDEVLGSKISCQSLSGIASNITCDRLSNRKLYIDGIESYEVSPERPISIEISGIINPNRIEGISNFGISIGIKKKDSNAFIDYVEEAVKISPLKAPGWAFFYSIAESNKKCRYTADYTINFTATASIPKLSSEGAVILDLPNQFEIDEKIIKTVSYSTEFGTALNSEIKKNRVWITGNTNEFSGNLKLKVRSVDNPIDEVQTSNFIVRTYDGVNKKVIERSFENLDPHYKSYVYPGPLIIINQNKPIEVPRGTQSDEIPIYIQGIAALNLTLVPTTPGFQVLPYNVQIQIGELYSYFRISVASDYDVEEYTITWAIEGELIPRIYTPIKPTIVKVLKTPEITIQIDTISKIPFGGTSLPVFFKVEKAPDIGFTILLNMKKNYKGIKLSKSTLEFSSGTKVQQFRIYYNDTKAATEEAITAGFIDMQLFGVNKDLFLLPYNTLKFEIITQDVIAPLVTSLKLDSVGKTGANFTLIANEECYAYFMYALAGTRQPNKNEMVNMGPAPFNSTRSKYGVSYVYSNLTTYVNLTNLEPQIDYVLYVMLQDRGARVSSTYGKVLFTTKNRDNAADVLIKLKQSYISAYDVRIALDMIALILSLPAENVIKSKYTFTQDTTNLNSRRLLPSAVTDGKEKFTETTVEGNTKLNQINILLNFNIISVITSEIYPTPKELGNKLNSKKAEITARVDNFDSDYIITSTEFLVYRPNFVTPPEITEKTYANVTFRTRLNNYGWIFAVCIERESKERSNSKPNALQISLGLDSEAIEVPNGKIEVEKKYEFYSLSVTGLTPSTAYTLYVIGGNAHPGYPDLMEDKFITGIDFTSAEAPPVEKLNLGDDYEDKSSMNIVWFVVGIVGAVAFT